MTPNFKGLRGAMDKLRHDLDVEAAKVHARIQEVATDAAPEAFRLAHAAIDSVKSDIKEIEDFVSDLRKSNGGDPLTSVASQGDSEPRSSDVAAKQ